VIVMSEGRITGELAADEATQEQVMHFATLRPASEGEPDDARALSTTGQGTTEKGGAGER
jgi:ribose transport system ATP-binding protein